MNNETKEIMVRTFESIQELHKEWKTENVSFELQKIRNTIEASFRIIVDLEVFVDISEIRAVLAAVELLIKYWGADVLQMNHCDTILVHELGIYSPWQLEIEGEV